MAAGGGYPEDSGSSDEDSEKLKPPKQINNSGENCGTVTTGDHDALNSSSVPCHPSLPIDELKAEMAELKTIAENMNNRLNALESHLKLNYSPTKSDNCSSGSSLSIDADIQNMKSVTYDSFLNDDRHQFKAGTSPRKRTSGLPIYPSDSEDSNTSLSSPPKRKRSEFTEADRQKMVDYIVENKLWNTLGLNSGTWARMAKALQLDHDHPYVSLETHFRKNIMKRIEDYVQDSELLAKFKKRT